MTDSILQVQKLKKMIGRKTIVSDLDFELEKGEIFGFLGPNGAGKTTTIRMIAGLSKITEGNIYIDGKSVKGDFKSAIRDVGVIIENPDMYKYMTGIDNLRLFGAMYKVRDKRISEMLETVSLGRAAHDKVKTYSLGMKQRLGIAQALLHEPKLLILDEPTNGLDPAGMRELRELLRGLVSEKKLTVFVSSHILSEMQQLCDRVCIINKGKIVAVNTVDEILKMAEGSTAKLLLRIDKSEEAAALLARMNLKHSITKDGLLVETEKDRVPEIVAALTAGGVAIYGMDSLESQSFEDIFMKFTGEER